jgi:hypothetical protein
VVAREDAEHHHQEEARARPAPREHQSQQAAVYVVGGYSR